MSVNLRRLDARMPQQLLDGVDIRPIHDQVAGEGVAQRMKRNALELASLGQYPEVSGKGVPVMGAVMAASRLTEKKQKA